MLIESGAQVNAEGGFYGSALQAACVSGYKTMAAMLIDRGADVNVKSGHYGTAVGAAAYTGKTDIVKLILAHDPTNQYLDLCNRSPLMWAARGGELSLIRSLWSSALVRSSRDATVEDKLGRRLIHHFAMAGCSAGIHALLQVDQHVDQTDSQGWTSLHWATYLGHEEVVRLLLAKDADMSCTDTQGWTAYQLSIFVGESSLSQLLMSSASYPDCVESLAGDQLRGTCDACRRVSYFPLAHCPICLVQLMIVKQDLIGYQYHCASCTSFDLCFRCIQDVKYIHSPHSFVTEFRYPQFTDSHCVMSRHF